MNRLFFVLAAALPLAACTTVEDPFLETGALKADGPSLATSVPAEYALAGVPGLVAVTIRQTVRDNHAEQTILFANDTDLAGENALSVTIGKGEAGLRAAPSRTEVEAEMRGILGGIRMTVSPVIAENAYGVFGYATGPLQRNGSCVYAWQLARNLSSGSFGAGNSVYRAQVRLRYCSTGMTQDRAALLMQGLRIAPVSTTTFHPLQFSGVGRAVTVAPLYQTQPVVAAVEQPIVERPVRRAARRIAVKTAASPKAEVIAEPVVNAVAVPLPQQAAALAAGATQPAAALNSEPVVTSDTPIVKKIPVQPDAAPVRTAVIPMPSGIHPQ